MTSANLVAETGQAGDAAKFWVTKVSCATYWHSSFSGTATETTMSAEYDTASDARKTEIVNQYVTDETGTNIFTLTASKTKALLWKNFGLTHGVDGFMPYEGGYDNGYSEDFTRATYFAPALHTRTQNQYTYIDSIGSFPSIYTLSGVSNWGFFNPNIYATPSTQWDAVIAYNTPETPAQPTQGGGGAARTWPKDQKANEKRKRQLKEAEAQLESTIRQAYQRLTGKVTEPEILTQEASPQKLAIHAEKLAAQLAVKAKNSAKQRTRNKTIIEDLKRQAHAIMQEEEAIITLLH